MRVFSDKNYIVFHYPVLKKLNVTIKLLAVREKPMILRLKTLDCENRQGILRTKISEGNGYLDMVENCHVWE